LQALTYFYKYNTFSGDFQVSTFNFYSKYFSRNLP